MPRVTTTRYKARRSRAYSLIELLISLAITATVLMATMVAMDACFKAYGDAARQASTQTITRMVVHRLLKLVRTSTAHGPLLPDPMPAPPVTLDGNTLNSSFVELLDSRGNIVRVEYRADDRQLWLIANPGEDDEQAQPLINGVSQCQFFLNRRMNDQGLWVLERGTMDMTVETEADATLTVENGQTSPVRVVASTMPRKIE